MFAIVVFGTYVDDEEFLLEVTAISAGEQLNAIRESRSFERLTVNNEQQTNAELSNTLKTLLNTKQPPEKIIAELEEHRDLLEIESDIPGLETVDKQAIKIFSQIGVVHESQFFNIMQQHGFNHDEAQDSFEKLGAADYLKNQDNDTSIAQLTTKGLKLAQKLVIPHTQL